MLSQFQRKEVIGVTLAFFVVFYFTVWNAVSTSSSATNNKLDIIIRQLNPDGAHKSSSSSSQSKSSSDTHKSSTPSPSPKINTHIIDPFSPESVQIVEDYYQGEDLWTGLKEVGRQLTALIDLKIDLIPGCPVVNKGQGWGGHAICSVSSVGCTFISFGVEQDYSFDEQLAKEGCRGASLDPTVSYTAKLSQNNWFLEMGATSLDVHPEWVTTSVPSLTRFLSFKKVSVLKMDCEGCEYAIGRDVILEDPSFFDRVENFAVEIHVGKMWMQTEEHLKNYARLLNLLLKSGLVLQHANIAHCNPDHERIGCYPGLAERGYPCKEGSMCQNLLFSRKVYVN